MKIGIVTVWKERGASYVSQQYAHSLLDQGAEVFIYSRGGEKNLKSLQDNRINNITAGKDFNIHIPTFILKNEFEKWLSINNIEYVIFNEQHWWEPVLWCKRLNIITGAYVDYYKEDTLPLFGLYDFLLCNTKRHYKLFKNHQGSVYIPWGTQIQKFQPNEYKNKTLTFIHSAGMNPYRKGTDLLIEASAKLKGEFQIIIHAQKKLKVHDTDKVKIIQHEIDPPDFYKQGDIYVYPSRLDGIGLTLAEAISSGLAVITSDNPPMNEFFHEEIGQTVALRKLFCRSDAYYWPQCEVDVEDLAKTMQFFIDNKELTEKYKANARQWAVNNLDWEHNSSELLLKIKEATNKENPLYQSALEYYSSFRKKGFNKINLIIEKYPRLSQSIIKLSKKIL